jgi:integrase
MSKVLLAWNDAEDWIMNTKSGVTTFEGPITVQSFLNYWLNLEKEKIGGNTTIINYECLLKNHIFPSLGDIRLRDLSPQIIDQFYFDVKKNWREKHKNNKTTGERTLQIIHHILHLSLSRAVIYGYIDKNPTEGVDTPKYKPAERQILSVDEVNHLLEVAWDTPEYCLLYLALTTGMRMGELHGLQWSDIDFSNSCLYVNKQMKYIPKIGMSFSNPKTEAGKRAIDLSNGTIIALMHQLEQQKIHKAFIGPKWVDQNLVFPNLKGKPRSASTTEHAFYRILSRAGINRITFHGLRHTTATILLNSDIPTIKVSKVLGHSKPSTTTDIYGHAIPDHKREVAKIMDEIVTPNIQGQSKEFSYIHHN